MEKSIQERLLSLIKKALVCLGWDKCLDEEPLLDLTSEIRFGDLTTNVAMKLSKALKNPGRQIAAVITEEMLKQLSLLGLEKIVKEIKIEGPGFINFYLEDAYYYGRLAEIILRGKEAFARDAGKAMRVLIEFVSANPTGSLSVAHARQAAVGDSLAKILTFCGFRVQKEYYLNDEGNQINILGKSVELRFRELKGESVDFPAQYYQGDYIYDIARMAKEEDIAQGRLGDFAAACILKIIKQELDDFGVRFDCWYSQRELSKSGKIEKVFALLKEKGLLYEEGGALWFKSSSFGDDKDRVVVKSDGSQTYLAPDIAYHEDKFKRGFQWLINLWGPDHHGYIGRIKASIQACGHSQDKLSVIIVQLATIFRNGSPVQMSTRRGQYITLREVLDEVGADAARFFFLMRRTSSHLDFDLEVAKKQDAQNPVYYVQYAHARICSILRSAGQDAQARKIQPELLKEKEEKGLMRKISEFDTVLNVCLCTCDPYMLTVYLQELAESFHKFYDLHRVLGQEQQLTLARLGLLQASKTTFSLGLELLGVSRPEKM